MPGFLDYVGDEVTGRRKRHEMNGSRRDTPIVDMICAPPATCVLINIKKLDSSSIVPSTPPSQSKIRLRHLNQLDVLVQLTKRFGSTDEAGLQWEGGVDGTMLEVLSF